MIRKNLFLLEYMVKNRIEKDTERLEAIKSVGNLLSKINLNIDEFKETEQDSLLEKLAKTKEKPLTVAEHDLIDEIIKFHE